MNKKEYIVGYHTIQALLSSQSDQVHQLFIHDASLNSRQEMLVALAKKKHVPVIVMHQNAFRAFCEQNCLKNKGIIAETESVSGLAETMLPILLQEKQEDAIILILDGIQDPRNLGACLRSADAFGSDVVIAPKDRAVGMTSVVRSVACGATANIPFVQVTNLARTLRWLQSQGVWLVGTVMDAPQSLCQVDCRRPIAMILGSEGKGLRHLTKKHCDYLASIPMVGDVESLNVSVAAGICLYEIQRQRTQ